MSGGITYDARVYRTEVYKGSKVTTYKVRWKVGGRLWKAGFRTAAQADSFRSALLTAARHGEAFSLPTGRPTAWEREKAATRAVAGSPSPAVTSSLSPAAGPASPPDRCPFTGSTTAALRNQPAQRHLFHR